jgi:hypothetical protein
LHALVKTKEKKEKEKPKNLSANKLKVNYRLSGATSLVFLLVL